MNRNSVVKFFLSYLGLVFLSLLLFSFVSVSESNVLSVVDKAVAWLGQNWAVTALVVSEIAGVLPGKVSGILSGLVRLGNWFFSKKVSKS